MGPPSGECAHEKTPLAQGPHAQSLRRLYPEPAAKLTAAQAVASLDPRASAVADRPYIICNCVATADEKATVDGRSGPLSDEADHELFRRLRTRVDAVLVGAGTLRIERYGRLVRDPKLRNVRQRAGLHADPLACMLTRSLHLPIDIPIFQDPDSTIAVYTSAAKSLPVTPARVEVTRMAPDQLTMTAALHHLHNHHGVGSVLCGRRPHRPRTAARRAAPRRVLPHRLHHAAGGTELPISTGQALSESLELRLLWVLEHQNSLFLRYAITHAATR